VSVLALVLFPACQRATIAGQPDTLGEALTASVIEICRKAKREIVFVGQVRHGRASGAFD